MNYQTLKNNSVDGIIVIGGDGSFRAAHEFWKNYKVPCIGIPASIDNDINGVDATIGSDTAINTALAAIDNIRDTATSMERLFVVEVMGRESGYIALQVALAGGCEDVIIPEKRFNLENICHAIVEGNLRGKLSWIIVVAEGAGSAFALAKKITEITSLETRPVVLGHIQRGGVPTAWDRILATRLGAASVDLLLQGRFGKAAGTLQEKINIVDLSEACQNRKIPVEEYYRLIKVLT